MSTPYSTQNQLFSDNAHIAAQKTSYPLLFNVPNESLHFTTTSLSIGEKECILDGEMAIDRIVKVSVQWFQNPIEFTIQERFRKEKYREWQDITITEWNHKTNVKSELFKLNAGIFLYGYFDGEHITQSIAINSTGLLHRLVFKRPTIKTVAEARRDKDKNCIIRGFNPRSQQNFLCFRFEHLRLSGVVLSEYNVEAS